MGGPVQHYRGKAPAPGLRAGAVPGHVGPLAWVELDPVSGSVRPTSWVHLLEDLFHRHGFQ